LSILGGYKELRKRLKSVRLWSVMAITLGILVIVALWGVNQYRGKANFHNYLTNMWAQSIFRHGRLCSKHPITSFKS
jgi:hypothetical protein